MKYRLSIFIKTMIMGIIAYKSVLNVAKTQESFNKIDELLFEEIPVLVLIEGYGQFYSNAIYSNADSKLFLNVEEIFKNILLPCKSSPDGTILFGFLENENKKYTINSVSSEVIVEKRVIKTQGKMLTDMGSIYLESEIFYEAFGISITFNFRSLTIILKSNFELPIIKQRRLEKLRNNISKIKNEFIPDTLIERNYNLFKFGNFDWAVSTHQSLTHTSGFNNLRLGLGTELLFGETNFSINHYSNQVFDNSKINYNWRWVDNSKKAIKQVNLGKLSTSSITELNSFLVGATVRNSSTSVRNANGYFTIKDNTEPNWLVELYINGILTDFIKADASGFYLFNVPLMYGYNTVNLRFYGPMGEERFEEKIINLPYTIMPKGEFEYCLISGFNENNPDNKFYKFETNYGLNKFFTLNTGIEYYTATQSQPFIPYVNITVLPFNKITVNTEYAHTVRTKSILNWYFSKDFLAEIEVIDYHKNQKVINTNMDSERKLKLSKSNKISNISLLSRVDFNQFIYKNLDYNQLILTLSSYYRQISFNLSNQTNWVNAKKYNLSDIAISYRFNKGLIFKTSVQFLSNEQRISFLKFLLEKRHKKTYYSLSYEKNIMNRANFLNFSFSYELPFARLNSSTTKNKDNFDFVASMQGGIAFDCGKKKAISSRNNTVGKGGISLNPFLDLNRNGVYDTNEHLIFVQEIKANGGNINFDSKDSIIRITELNPFTYFNFEMNNNSLDNIAWKFKYNKHSVLIDPNQFKKITIPIIPLGEVNGFVSYEENGANRGLSKILINIYDKKSLKLIRNITSEPDGYFNYLGLEDGDYIALIDSIQLQRLKLNVDIPLIEFTILPLEQGDIVDNVNFKLSSIREVFKTDSNRLITNINIPTTLHLDTINQKTNLKQLKNIREKVSIKYIDKREESNKNILIWGEMCDSIGFYFVQCGAFKNKNNAILLAKKLKNNTNLIVGVVLNAGFYKVQLGCFKNKVEAYESSKIIKGNKLCDDIFINNRKNNEWYY